MGSIMDYIKAFAVGGMLCVVGQVLIDCTKLTPARILTSYVVAGVVLGALGIYQPLADFALAGASVPLTGFGNALAKGVREAVAESGVLGAFTGGLTACAGGICAAVFFALEVVSIGVLYYSGLIPCITSSLVAYAVSLRFGIEPMRFAVAAPETGALTLARAAVLALGCALVSILFCEALHRTEHLAERLVKNDYLRAFLGGCLVIALTLLAGCRDYNGAGGHVIAAALGGTAKPEAFLLKIVFTAVTLGCGFKGGEIVPTLFVGSTFGCAAGALLGLPAGFAAALGITGLFCGMTNCPITSLLISVELFGADGLLCYAVVCAVSYVCSGYRGLYSSQTILYSKLRAEFINVHTK